MTAFLAAAAAAVAAYWAGRLRLGSRLLSWAEDRFGGPRRPGWWVAQAVALVAVVWMVTVHPRRSAANRRSWREAKRAPAPVFDSQWISKRGETSAGEGR